jgi:hypothetical protein
MRRILCLFLGHRLDVAKEVLGFRVRQCRRCGKAEVIR